MQHDDKRFLDLLRRWQSGDFTRADERELNALTASDVFRREAMEGFMSLPEEDHDARINSLYTRLQDRTGTGLTRRISITYIGAAAAVLVVLLAALWFFPQKDRSENAPVAQTQMEPAGSGTAEAPAPSLQSPENEQGSDVAIAEKSAPSASRPSQTAPTDRPMPVPGAGSSAGEIAAVEEISVQQDQMVAAPPAAPLSIPSEVMPDKTLSKPAKAETTGEEARSEAATKAKKAKESAARAKDSTWHDTDRKPDMEAARKEAREANLPQSSEPAGGWDAFREYLRQNARLTARARNNNISGTVQIKFTVNANGEPQNFVTLRPLGYGCDEEAIRLIKSWDWVRGKNPEVTVDISFVR